MFARIVARSRRRYHTNHFAHRCLSSSSPVNEGDKNVLSLPTHIKFRMPDLNFEQISAGPGGVTLSKWMIKEGDKVVDDTHMCEIDTPDLVFTLDSGDVGYLARILVPEGTKDVPDGQPLAIIVPEEKDIVPFIEALKQHPNAIEGYIEPLSTQLHMSCDETEEEHQIESVAVLRQLHNLQKEGRFKDEEVFKTLKALARKNDTQLLLTFQGSFENSIFDADFFVENASDLAEDVLRAQAENNKT